MMSNEASLPGYGVAIPFDDIAVDEFEPEGLVPGIGMTNTIGELGMSESIAEGIDEGELDVRGLLLLSPWAMGCVSEDGSDPEELVDIFIDFWKARGDVWFMQPGTSLEVSGVVRGHPDFPEGVPVSGLKVVRLVRVLRQSVPSKQSESGRIAHDLIVLIGRDGVNFGIFSDNAARLCLS